MHTVKEVGKRVGCWNDNRWVRKSPGKGRDWGAGTLFGPRPLHLSPVDLCIHSNLSCPSSISLPRGCKVLPRELVLGLLQLHGVRQPVTESPRALS